MLGLRRRILREITTCFIISHKKTNVNTIFFFFKVLFHFFTLFFVIWSRFFGILFHPVLFFSKKGRLGVLPFPVFASKKRAYIVFSSPLTRKAYAFFRKKWIDKSEEMLYNDCD